MMRLGFSPGANSISKLFTKDAVTIRSIIKARFLPTQPYGPALKNTKLDLARQLLNSVIVGADKLDDQYQA